MELILPLVLYLGAIYILVMSRKSLARVLNGRKDEETVLTLNFSGRQLLHTAIIVICLVVFLNELPSIISRLTGNWGSENYSDGTENGYMINRKILDSEFYASIFRVVLTIIFAFLAKSISTLWSNKQENPSH